MKLDYAYTTPSEVIDLVMGRDGNAIVPTGKIAELVKKSLEQIGLTTDQTLFYMPEASMAQPRDFAVSEEC